MFDRFSVSRPRLRVLTAVILGVFLLGFWYACSFQAEPFWQGVEPSSNAHPSFEDTESDLLQLLDEPQILVHITGAIQQPGVYWLSIDARVIDLVQRAGGFRDDAEPASINLARVVRDAELIHIPIMGEQPEPQLGTHGQQLININTATREQLDTLPRIGPSLAERIIRHRESHGAFSNFEGLLAVSGIGPAIINDLRDKITF